MDRWSNQGNLLFKEFVFRLNRSLRFTRMDITLSSPDYLDVHESFQLSRGDQFIQVSSGHRVGDYRPAYPFYGNN